MCYGMYSTSLFLLFLIGSVHPIVIEQQLECVERNLTAKTQSCNHLNFSLPNSIRPKHIIHYDDCKAKVLRCYCLTKTTAVDISSTNMTKYALGHCLEGCFITNKYSEYYSMSLTGNQTLCAPYHRTGILCGKCIDGYGPAVYSYSLRCVKCPDKGFWRRLMLYILVAYGPLTVFLAIIVIFTVSVNSAALHGWIFVSQIMTNSYYMRVLTSMAELHHIDQYSYRILGSILGIWNLDFFRGVYTPFCFYSSLSTFQVLALDYLIAAYPLAIIALLYTTVELYTCGFFLVTICVQPFVNCCIRFRHQLNIRTSLVDAFGTFFSLSYVKMLSTIVDLLMTTRVWETDKDSVSFRLYLDAETESFKGKHIPFAVVSLAVFLLFNLLPLVLLLLYSFPKTQCFVHHLPTSLQHALFPFLDNILSCYKDGTNETRNCRYFAVIYHISRIVIWSNTSWTETTFFFPVCTVVIMMTGMLVTFIRPYKSYLYNALDAFFLFCLAVSLTGNMAFAIAYMDEPQLAGVSVAFIVIPACIHVSYIIIYMGYKLWKLRKMPLIIIMYMVSRLLMMLSYMYKKIGGTDDEITPLVSS